MVGAQDLVELGQHRRRVIEIQSSARVERWLAGSGVPGGVLAVVEAGEVVLLRGFGTTLVDVQTPFDPSHTVIRAGELVRPLTAQALVQLAADGRLELDRDLRALIGAAGVNKECRYPFSTRELLTHTAGFDVRVIGTRSRTLAELAPLRVYLDHRLPPQVRKPGHVAIPSQHGYALAGLVIEEITGLPFAAFLQNQLFRPLGMTRTSVTDDPSRRRLIATGYRSTARGLVPAEPDFSLLPPAGSFLTTATDMSRWLQAILAPSGATSPLLTRQFQHHPQFPGRTLGLTEGSRYSPPELTQATMNNGFSAVLLLLPEQELGMFLAVNLEIEIWSLAYALTDEILGWQASDTETRWLEHPERVSDFAGYYRHASSPMTTAGKILTLLGQERIRRTDSHDLLWDRSSYRAVDRWLFESESDGSRIGLVTDNGLVRWLVTRNEVFERLPWHQSKPVQLALWTFFAAALLATVRLRRLAPSHHQNLEPAHRQESGWQVTALSLAAVLHLIFLLTLAALLPLAMAFGATNLVHGAPRYFYFLGAFPFVAAVLTFVSAAGIAAIWLRRERARPESLRLAGLAGILLIYLPFLYSYGLLPLTL